MQWHTCSSGKCHTQIYQEDNVNTIGNIHRHHFLLLNGTLLLPPHKLRHMRPRSTGLIPSLLANTKLSSVEQNAHIAMQLCCRASPHIADNPPLPHACKQVPHPFTVEAMDIIIFLLGFTQGCPPEIKYNSVQAAPKQVPCA